jgi:hypothetical protein
VKVAVYGLDMGAPFLYLGSFGPERKEQHGYPSPARSWSISTLGTKKKNEQTKKKEFTNRKMLDSVTLFTKVGTNNPGIVFRSQCDSLP